jgi:hypothetical protein
MEVICEHAEQCIKKGTGPECWHTSPHTPLKFGMQDGSTARCSLVAMKCAATGKQCRCVPCPSHNQTGE